MTQNKQDNPLLNLSGLPQFSAITPEHVEPALDQLLTENRKTLEQLLNQPETFTWDNFVQPLEDMEERLHRMWSPVSHLNAVKDSEALRQAYDRCLPKLSEYATELGQNENLYKAFKQIFESGEFGKLTVAQQKVINNALRDFRLSGADLNDKDKQRYREIEQELSQLGNQFAKNVLDATQAWELIVTSDADLAGLPTSAIAQAKKAASGKNIKGWRFTLDGPSYIAFMTYADNRQLRRNMYEAYVCRASDQGPYAGQWDNGPIIDRELKLKQEKARLLGFQNYVELSLQKKMANTPDEVIVFLEDLAQRAKPAAQRELAELTQFAREALRLEPLEAWDVMYCAEKLRQRDYDLSQEDLRPYFPLPKVLQGMFEVVHKLYGIRITEQKNVDAWHSDVQFFNIHDAAGQLRGSFYLDLFAREHKRGGAWMDECVSRKRLSNSVQAPVAYLTCNFSEPVDEIPSLLTHQEVTTLFHEFGHGLHHLLTKVDYVSVSGINGVEWDAVELPSQFMENWCWQRESLDLFVSHYQTGEKLPDELYRKMQAARYFQSGMQMVRQLEFSLFDIKIHQQYRPGQQTVQQFLDEVRQTVAVLIPPAFNRFQNSFTHIFAGGYAAGYYSYKWAEVLSADAFSKFEKNGIFDRETGMRFLEMVLEQGGTRGAMDLFVEFRGRKPKIDALLRHAGLAA
ncbi:MAG: oligopeptidase A [Gammaproteobacteria bacterium]|nr:oligopeptidase A [Gammaproteobacteria bacterium]